MLQDIRENAQGTIAKVIIGLLIVTLSLWGVDAIVGGFTGQPEVATVNGEEITEQEFNRILQMERQRRLSEMETPDPSLLDDDQIRRSVLDAMIQEAVLTQDAARQGLTLSDEDIDRLITQMPQFQVDGQFNRDRFVAVLRNMGMGPLEFREAMRRQYVVNQIRGGLLESGLASPQAIEQLLRIQYQTRDFRTITLTPDQVSGQVTVSEADVKEYYENNAGEFMQPERVDAAYIELSLDKVAESIEVSEEELQAAYQARAQELAAEERQVAHILVEDGDNAEATLAEVQEKLAAGEEFAELARQYSDDPVSAEEGGDLGYAGRGVFEGAFEEAMFELEEGEISEPVETAYGTHLIKVLDVRKIEPPSFEAMKDELRQELAREQAVTRFAELRTRLADLAYSEDNLTTPAQELGLEVQTRSGVTRDGGEPPFDHPGLMRQLFSDDVLQDGYNTEVIDVAQDTSVVARVRDYHPAAQQPLSEVQEQIRAQLEAQRTREALEQLGRDLIARLQDGETLADLDVAVDNWQSHEDVTRTNTDISAPVLERAFELPRPQGEAASFGLTGFQDDLVVIALDEVTDGDVAERQDEVDQWQQFIASQMAQREYLAYREHLREKAEVERP